MDLEIDKIENEAGFTLKLPETRFSSFSATRSYPKPEQYFSGTRKQFSVNFIWFIIDNFVEIFRLKFFTKLKTFFKEELLSDLLFEALKFILEISSKISKTF